MLGDLFSGIIILPTWRVDVVIYKVKDWKKKPSILTTWNCQESL